MDIPGLGTMTKDEDLAVYSSGPIAVPVLGGKMCRFLVDNYEDDIDQQEFHVAIANFLSIRPAVLHAVNADVFRYYKDCNDSCWTPDDDEYLVIDSPADVWRYVSLGDRTLVSRRAKGDKGVYISLECNCEWEVEHGLELVFKQGLRVNKLGGFDGRLTNSDAYGDERLENVIYR